LVRRAQDYVEAHLNSTITATHLTSALHTSVRSLNRGFRRYLDTTPMAYVHECRLQAARRALLEQRDGDFVTRIAEDCGFSHLGRFAVDYKRRFGESPSKSLKGTWRVPAAAV
ncbi:MAG: helix-turn-helix transcriptional regulator, partial [Chromatiales bacterium]